MCLRHGVDLIFHATFADAEAIDALEKAKDRVFVAPTIGISYAALNEAAPWGNEARCRTATSSSITRDLPVTLEPNQAHVVASLPRPPTNGWTCPTGNAVKSSW
jgi:hypothetical protein